MDAAMTSSKSSSGPSKTCARVAVLGDGRALVHLRNKLETALGDRVGGRHACNVDVLHSSGLVTGAAAG
eukprot:13094014-Alexandrium_andersonii.AAC.1